jgi:hypothetical protein
VSTDDGLPYENSGWKRHPERDVVFRILREATHGKTRRRWFTRYWRSVRREKQLPTTP